MNDNDVKKGLDMCDNSFCEECPYRPKTINCRDELCHDSLAFINRLQAEIERLKKDLETSNSVIKNTFLAKAGLITDPLSEIKSEARNEVRNEVRKEFAEKLMEQVKAIHRAVDTSETNNDYNTGFHSATSQIQGLIAYVLEETEKESELAKMQKEKGEE